jgi:hypothetical protein
VRREGVAQGVAADPLRDTGALHPLSDARCTADSCRWWRSCGRHRIAPRRVAEDPLPGPFAAHSVFQPARRGGTPTSLQAIGFVEPARRRQLASQRGFGDAAAAPAVAAAFGLRKERRAQSTSRCSRRPSSRRPHRKKVATSWCCPAAREQRAPRA